ncbi:MAG: 50S ribosomal protein L13 [Candidatus Verstraetearchaeota archaeon]|nr:50S ribosomal protein L13 [Candidatus Verstraetearchaeota archaeon]
MQLETVVIDATDLRAGRMATYIAKMLLEGKRVVVINAEKAVISGKRLAIIERFKRRLERRVWKNPEKVGPKKPRRPDRLLYYVIRGMLPRKTPRGRAALRRLRVYMGSPQLPRNYPSPISIPDAHISKLRGSYVYLYDLARELGWSG